MLRQAPWPADVDPDQLDIVPTQQIATVSAIDNSDITTPEPDDTTGMLFDGNDNTAASQTQTQNPTAMLNDTNNSATASQTQTQTQTQAQTQTTYNALAQAAQVQPPQTCTPITAVPNVLNCHNIQVHSWLLHHCKDFIH